jgi:polyketide biosynthesis enoyl-CoA hydratase PksI
MSKTVELNYVEDSIAVVSMEEQEHRNTFSPALVSGLVASFERIREEDRAKAVVIHGYANYFCCGGTQEELRKIFQRQIDFTDLGIHRLLLDCEVPTIAAMQGHALGGGLAFGCCADLLVLAEESVYSANFMKYGFTPGMGSTYVIPAKLGPVLGVEMLLTARGYQGGELKERGAGAKVVRRAEVIPTAMSLARELADKPAVSLKLLKKHLTQRIREELPRIVQQELSMHEVTFDQPEVRERIEARY